MNEFDLKKDKCSGKNLHQNIIKLLNIKWLIHDGIEIPITIKDTKNAEF